jgi:uncharacterized protein (DUF488 family)
VACSPPRVNRPAGGIFVAMIYTAGHSTRSAEEFLALLTAHCIGRVVDVRRYPASRRHPQFAAAALAGALEATGIAYEHAGDLGGRRPPCKDSPHTAWRSAGFRGYADYMDTPAFDEALTRLVALDGEPPVAIMCAEAVPWRCHRHLIADALVARGLTVRHILGPAEATVHRLSPHAQVLAGGRLRYAASEPRDR